MGADERRQIDAISRELEGLVERKTAEIAVAVTSELASATPKATGLAAASWIPRVGQPSTERFGSRTPAGVAAAKTAQEAGTAAVRGFRLHQGKVHVTSNTHYIEPLNDGSSSKEPSGFVQRAIRKAVDRVR